MSIIYFNGSANRKSAAWLETPFSNINEESSSILSENGILLLRPTLDNAFSSRLSRLFNTIPIKF